MFIATITVQSTVFQEEPCESVLQEIADEFLEEVYRLIREYGFEDKIAVEASWEKGCVLEHFTLFAANADAWISLATAAGGYKVLKEYKDLREGALLITKDLMGFSKTIAGISVKIVRAVISDRQPSRKQEEKFPDLHKPTKKAKRRGASNKEIQKEQLNRIDYIYAVENILYRLVSYEHYFSHASNQQGQFWPMVQNSLGESVCIFWCHVFGNRSDELHFSKFFDSDAENIAGFDFSFANVKSKLLSAIKMQENEYEKFWQEVKTCRDQYIAHKEITEGIVFPRIDLCRKQAEELRDILKQFVSQALQKGVDGDWGRLDAYYNNDSNSNESIKKKTKSEFKKGILTVASTLG